jgi:hypothetical protein
MKWSIRVALQLGGCEPGALPQCACIGADLGRRQVLRDNQKPRSATISPCISWWNMLRSALRQSSPKPPEAVA